MPRIAGGLPLPNLLQSQLAFFGAIDDAVLYAQRGDGPNPDAVLQTVEALLPGTTGFGQAGWYGELEAFANRPELSVGDLRAVVRFPTVAEALRHLQASTAQPQTDVVAAVRGGQDSAPDSPELDDAYDPTQDPALARSTYAAMILAKIARINGLPPELGITRTMPARIIASAVNYWQGSTTRLTAPEATSDPTVQSLLSQLDKIDSRQSWQSFAAKQVDPLFAQQSLPCFGKLDNVDGQFISTIYTDATDTTLTVKNIEKVIDPRNWTLCCKFFCAVDAQDPLYTKRGWSRILEKISPEPEKWSLKTALIFYYGRDEAGGVFLNYDLDPHRQNDSGIVEVDKGYIWITPLTGDSGKKGVRIRTSKQERVQGLSPTATSALGCLLGWGDAAFKLLTATADVVIKKKVPPGVVVHPFKTTPPKGYESQVDHTSQQPPKPDTPAKLPPNFGTAVGNARDLLNDLINRTRDVGADAAGRWLDGVTREDVDKITDGVGTNLREFAVELYETAEDSVKPKETTTDKGRR
jgi:hypothetical protein